MFYNLKTRKYIPHARHNKSYTAGGKCLATSRERLILRMAVNMVNCWFQNSTFNYKK